MVELRMWFSGFRALRHLRRSGLGITCLGISGTGAVPVLTGMLEDPASSSSRLGFRLSLLTLFRWRPPLLILGAFLLFPSRLEAARVDGADEADTEGD